MPRFYTNVRYRDRLFVDEEGDELAYEHAVHSHALNTARDLIAHTRMHSIRNWLDCAFEITDEAGRIVLVLPFSETINENEAACEQGAGQGLISEADAP